MSDLSYTTGIQHDIHGNPMAMFSTAKGGWRIPVEVATHIALADEARHARIKELEDAIRQQGHSERCGWNMMHPCTCLMSLLSEEEDDDAQA